MRNIITIILTALTINANAADWYLFTAAPVQTNGITVIDVRVPVGRNDDLKQYVFEGWIMPPAGSFPALTHPATAGAWVNVTKQQIDARESLLSAHIETLTPESRVRGIRLTGPARVEIDGTDGHVYGLEVDPADGDVMAVQRESERKTWAQYSALRGSNLTARAARRARLLESQESGESTNTWASKIADYRINRQAVVGQIAQYTNHLAQLDVILSAAGPDRAALNTAIASLSGATKTAFQKSLAYEDAKDAKMRQMLNDLKAAAQNLKQEVQDLKQAVNAALNGK